MLDSVALRQHILDLDKGDDAAQRKALHSLRDLEESEWDTVLPSELQALVALLQQQLLGETKQSWTHREVATILGNIGPRSKAAIEQLIQLSHDGVPGAGCEAVVKALGRCGSQARGAVDPLIVLANRRSNLAVHAVRALGDIGCADHRVRSALVALWLSPAQAEESQLQIAIALCKLRIDAQGVLQFLISKLASSQSRAVRKSAAEALAWRNKDEADVVPILLTAALTDGNEEVRETAQTALNQLHISQEAAIDVCAKQLKDSSYAETALRKSGRPAVSALIKVLHSGEPTTRIKATQILAFLGELAAEAVPALTKALRDKSSDIRLAAAKGLWNITKKADVLVPVLVRLLEEKGTTDLQGDESRRRFLQTVIEALGRIGPAATAAVPALMKKTKDANRLVSESAANALGRIVPSSLK
jgi:HEAT repeat protein